MTYLFIFIFQKIGNEVVLPSDLWHELTGSVGGGRDVLIFFQDLSSHPKAVPRRSSELTIEDKQALRSQGVTSDCQDELFILTARYKLDKECKIVGVKSGKISKVEIMECTRHLLTTTKNDGGKITKVSV